MAEQENQNSNEKPETKQPVKVPEGVQKPDPNIKPPNFEYVSEGFEAKKDKKVIYSESA